MLLVSVFFLFIIPHVFSLNFNFTSFQDSADTILYEKAATIAGTSIDLVTNTNLGVGRATYHEPMHLWDKDTGKLTDFTTKFTFVIDSQGENIYADGMTFFLASYGSKLPNILSEGGGGLMGLILDSKHHPFVAVEFDIFPNTGPTEGWDPPYVHVGVDINSIQSVTNATWSANITGGRTNEAFISYNASTHNLSISFTGFDTSNNIMWQHLHHIVDLTKYLPEWVTFGFSASIGKFSAKYKIHTWSFYSEDFPNIASSLNPIPSLEPSPSITLRLRSRLILSRIITDAIALAIGLRFGGLVLVCGVVWFVLWKNKNK